MDKQKPLLLYIEKLCVFFRKMISLSVGRIVRTPVLATTFSWHKPVRDLQPVMINNSLKGN